MEKDGKILMWTRVVSLKRTKVYECKMYLLTHTIFVSLDNIRLSWPDQYRNNELATIDELTNIVEEHAGTKLKHRDNLNAPKGVNGGNSDNTLIRRF